MFQNQAPPLSRSSSWLVFLFPVPRSLISSAFSASHLMTLTNPTSDIAAVRSAYEQAGQSHVFRFWDTLSADEQTQLYRQLANVDPVHVEQLRSKALEAEKNAASVADELTQPPSEKLTEASAAEWHKVGLDAIKEGKVGVLLLAGGQGTRLGSSAPKGCYDIGLPSHKSLFQLQAERIKRLGELAGLETQGITWYVMTSGPTRQETERFFEDKGWFGLRRQDVVFFQQGELRRRLSVMLRLTRVFARHASLSVQRRRILAFLSVRTGRRARWERRHLHRPPRSSQRLYIYHRPL
jgi:UDP-N-acetylglucosamine pyrophosphorylase